MSSTSIEEGQKSMAASQSLGREAVKIVFLCVCWYSSSAGSNVTLKKILQVFPFPMTISMVHVVILTCLLGPILALLNVEPTPHLHRRFYIRRILPLACGKVLASISSHISILRVPVSYAHTGKNGRVVKIM